MQNRYDKCPNCMQTLGQGEDVCPYCGFSVSGYEEKPNCLRPFTVLQGKYMIGRVIGMGGFGITYIGWDLNLQTYIAIKEYYPDSFASRDTRTTTVVTAHESSQEVYNKGMTRYVEEARNLSKFYRLQGIVSVKDFFYENGTGYIVMEYINGVNLKEYLNSVGGKMDEATVLSLMKPVLESLYQVHNNGLVHRDISPDNIMVDNEGKIKLIDFGSVRGQSAESDKTYTVILKHGYAPPEQYYAKGRQGAWTDIYSLCATMYKMLTGEVPPNGVERMEEDTYRDPSSYGVAVSPRTEAVLRKGLAVKAQERYQNIGEMLTDLYGTGAVPQTPVMPQASPAGVPGPMSASAQSMHLAPERPTGSAQKKKKIGIIAGISVAAVALIVGLVLILGGGTKDKEKDNTEIAASEDDTEDTEDIEDIEDIEEEDTTEAATTGDGDYVWPTELSDSWRDYTVNIDGTIYQFPLPYTEWKEKGWQADTITATVASGEETSVTCYNDRAKLTALIANPSLSEAELNDCYVIGFSFDYYDDDCQDDFTVELSNGIKLLSATESDIKTAFGAPEYRYDGEYYDKEGVTYVSLDYAGDGYEDGMDLEVSSEDNLVAIRLINTATPESATSVDDLDTSEPAINSRYEAPTGASAERFDNIVTIGDKNYKLPVPFTELQADGWILDTSAPSYIGGNTYESTSMEKDGEKIDIMLNNFTSNAILTMYGCITSISVDADYYTGSITFPGGVSLGDDDNTFESLYSDLGDDYSRDDSFSTFIAYNVWHEVEDVNINIYMYSDPDTGKITDYTYTTFEEWEE